MEVDGTGDSKGLVVGVDVVFLHRCGGGGPYLCVGERCLFDFGESGLKGFFGNGKGVEMSLGTSFV